MPADLLLLHSLCLRREKASSAKVCLSSHFLESRIGSPRGTGLMRDWINHPSSSKEESSFFWRETDCLVRLHKYSTLMRLGLSQLQPMEPCELQLTEVLKSSEISSAFSCTLAKNFKYLIKLRISRPDRMESLRGIKLL